MSCGTTNAISSRRGNNLRKRARDERKGEKQKRKDKKTGVISSDSDDEGGYEIRDDEFGVFEFPWMQKEGELSKFDELLEPRDSLFGILEATKKIAEDDKLSCMQEQDSLLLGQDLLDCKFDAQALPPFPVVDDLDSLFDDPPK